MSFSPAADSIACAAFQGAIYSAIHVATSLAPGTLPRLVSSCQQEACIFLPARVFFLCRPGLPVQQLSASEIFVQQPCLRYMAASSLTVFPIAWVPCRGAILRTVRVAALLLRVHINHFPSLPVTAEKAAASVQEAGARSYSSNGRTPYLCILATKASSLAPCPYRA